MTTLTTQELIKDVDMLATLPLITGEPVGIVLYKPKMIRAGVLNQAGFQLPDGTKLYASPQSLQPITADDVTDAMADEVAASSAVIGCACFWEDTKRNEIIAAAYNAVIKHKRDTK